MPTNRFKHLNSRFDRQADRDEQTGRRAEDAFLERTEGFDAQRAAGTAARAHFDQFAEDLRRDLSDFRGAQIGAGRLNTGFRFEDEDELFRQGLADLGRTLAQNALSAESLNLRNTAQLGAFGEGATNRFLDVLAGQRDTELSLEEMRRRDEERKRSGMFGFLGRVGGSLLGPAGSVVGGKIGDAVEGLF